MTSYQISPCELVWDDLQYKISHLINLKDGDIAYIYGNTATQPEKLVSILAGAAQLQTRERKTGTAMHGERIKILGSESLCISKDNQAIFQLSPPTETIKKDYQDFLRNRVQLIGYIFGEPRQYIIGSSVKEEYFFSCAAVDSEFSIEQARLGVLKKYGLYNKTEMRTERLSGGESHRLNFACVLESEPSILICDLSAANLDEEFVQFILEHIEQNREKFITIIFNGGRKAFFDISNSYIMVNREGEINHVKAVSKIEIEDRLNAQDNIYLKHTIKDDKDLLDISNLNYYSRTSEPLSLKIKYGDCILIKGNNGSGKTTFAKIISEQLEPTSGAIYKPSGKITSVMTFQYPTAFPSMMLLKKILDEQKLREFNWEEFGNFSFADLPKGIQKYSYIMYMLKISADLFILDEPFAGIDYIHQLDIAKQINRMTDSAFLIMNHEPHILCEKTYQIG